MLFSSQVLVAVALLAAGVVLVPWQPAASQTFKGFDTNLLYVEKSGSSTVDFKGGDALISTQPGSAATLHTLSTPNNFTANFNITIEQANSGTPAALPFAARLWFPGTSSWIAIEFRPGPDGHIFGGSFYGFHELALTDLGPYATGVAYQVVVSWQREVAAVLSVMQPSGSTTAFTVSRSDGFALFASHFVNLSLTSSAADASQRVAISQFNLVIPPVTAFAAKAADWRLTALSAAIVVWFLAYVARRFLPTLSLSRPVQFMTTGAFRSPHNLGNKTLVVLGALVFVAVYAALAPVDGHPYDRLAQESYAYVSVRYGLGALYQRTDYIPDAVVRAGHTSWSSPPFAYPPVMAYPYWLIGQTWRVLHGPITPMVDRGFQVFWKLALALFVLVNAIAIFYLARTYIDTRWAILAAGFYAFNPAVLFDAVGWGETEAILTSALLIATVGFVKDRPKLGWSALIVATLIKQTALFALPLMALYSWRKYGFRRSIIDGSFGFLTGFVASVPLIFVGYGPATIYRSIAGQILNFANPNLVNASSDTFSIWTLVIGLRGVHGFDRIWAPFPLQFGVLNLPFSAAGTICFALVMITILGALLRVSAPEALDEALLVSIAAMMCWYVVFSTLASARYLVLGIPFLILAAGFSRLRSRLWMIVGLTAIAFISMYGVLMEIAARGDWPDFYGLGNSTTNPLSGAVFGIYTSDWGITGGAVLLLLIAITLLSGLLGGISEAVPRDRARLAFVEPS